MEEFERRVELANRTDSADALRALITDLPRHVSDSPPAPAPAPARTSGTVPAYLENPGRPPAQDELISIFSTNHRVGRWTASRKMEVTSIFGSGNVDLREAMIPRGGIKIEAVGIFGSTTIVVPEGVNVRVQRVTIFGSVSDGGNRIENPSAPTLEIEAIGIFGSVNILVKARE